MSRGCWGLGTRGLPTGRWISSWLCRQLAGIPGQLVASPALAALCGHSWKWGRGLSSCLRWVMTPWRTVWPHPQPRTLRRPFVHDFQQIYGPQIKKASAHRYAFILSSAHEFSKHLLNTCSSVPLLALLLCIPGRPGAHWQNPAGVSFIKAGSYHSLSLLLRQSAMQTPSFASGANVK